MSNSPLMDMFYKMWVDGERDPQAFLEAGKAKSNLCSMMHVNRYLTQFEKGLTPNKVKREDQPEDEDVDVHPDADE